MRLRLTALLLPFLLPLFAVAQTGLQPTGNLTIFSEEGDAFYLIMNGQRINSSPQTHVRVELLPQPYYTVKIIFTDTALTNLSKSRLAIADVDGTMKDVTYRIKKDRKKGRKLVYASSIPAAQNYTPEPGVYVRQWGQPEGQPPVIIQGPPSGTPPPPPRPGYGNNRTPPPAAPPPGSSGASNNPPPANAGPCRYAMKPADFNAALSTISKISFDETRLSTARSIVSINCVTTDQVIQICGLFSFEANKLDFAKIAYGRVIDPGNYFRLADIFKFNSSKEELSRFIQGL